MYRKKTVFGLQINSPDVVKKITNPLKPPTACPYCSGAVTLVTNDVIYGEAMGWPLIYYCQNCYARVSCHPGTNIPMGVMADRKTQKARVEAHQHLDALLRGKSDWHRQQLYKLIAAIMGVRIARISYFNAEECNRIIQMCKTGAITV